MPRLIRPSRRLLKKSPQETREAKGNPSGGRGRAMGSRRAPSGPQADHPQGMEPKGRETHREGPPALRVELSLLLRTSGHWRGPLADPSDAQRGGVLPGTLPLRKRGWLGQGAPYPAGLRQGGMAHGQGGRGTRGDTPGVSAIELSGAPTCREVMALEQRRRCKPLLRGDQRTRRGTGGAMRGAVRSAGDHPLLHTLPLVAGGGVRKQAYPAGLGIKRLKLRVTAKKRIHLYVHLADIYEKILNSLFQSLYKV